MAKLYFRYGAMGSSKTANAVMVQYNYRERGQRVLMLKPKLENRDGANIVRSRCGMVFPGRGESVSLTAKPGEIRQKKRVFHYENPLCRRRNRRTH